MDLKKPLTLYEQIDRLKYHNMKITDTDYARKILGEINYYRFTGYAFQFKDKDNPDDYQKGTDFNDIVKLYMFDAELRCILKKQLDIVELYARSKIAYEFSLIKC